MCGRFSLRARLNELLEDFAIDEPDVPFWEPRYNVAPTQPVVVVRAKSSDGSNREAALLRWGLIPAWASDPSIGNRLINARSETVAEKPAFRNALARRRCLVAADGFFEWKAEGKSKQPYFIHFSDDRPFAFAGLWECWEGPDHSRIESCTILTTEANELMRPIHDRMPVIVPKSDYAAWLDSKRQDARTLLSLLAPYAGVGLEAFPVSQTVNNPRHDVPECVNKAAIS
jgi:putative SOS response-associated peptidase YedK